MPLTNEEKETTINYNDAEKEARIYTCNAALMRKLDRLCTEYPDLYKLVKQDEYSKWYIIPKKYIRIGKPVAMSDEQKAAASARAKAMRR
jgi:hypothetical protein